MTKQYIKDAFGWGFLLWFIGYALSIVLFMIIPHNLIGWVLMPIGTFITLFVLWKKIHAGSFPYYTHLAVIWLFIAVICDYLFLVRVFKPVDGYYKFDVYVYYALTLCLPLVVGWKKTKNK